VASSDEYHFLSFQWGMIALFMTTYWAKSKDLANGWSGFSMEPMLTPKAVLHRIIRIRIRIRKMNQNNE